MTDAKKTAAKKVVAREATEAKQAMEQETFADRQSRDTVEAGNIVQGKTEPRDLKNAPEQEDEQTRINREVEEAQGAKGSTASKEPGPKYKQ